MPFETCEPPCQPKGGYNVNLIPGQFGKDVAAAARVKQVRPGSRVLPFSDVLWLSAEDA